jgi:hypothetical protein
VNRFQHRLGMTPHPRRPTAAPRPAASPADGPPADAAPRPDTRSAPDLANGVLARLTAVNVRIEGLRQRLRRGEPPDCAQMAGELAEIDHQVDAAVTQLRALRSVAAEVRD